MAQVRVQRRNSVNRAARTYVFTVDHENGPVQVKTGCNMFSAPFLNDKGERCDSCLKCKEKPETMELCLYKKPEKKRSGKINKGEKKESKADYKTIIGMFLEGKSKASIMAFIQSFTTEAASKKMYGNCSCIFNACLFPNRKENLVHFICKEVLENSSTLEHCLREYEGKDKQTIKLVHNVALIYKAIKAEN